MIYRFWILFFIIITHTLFAQTDTLMLSGRYYQSNVYVYNPSISEVFSITQLIVNKDTINDELSTNGIEIDLSTYALLEGDRVDILIIYQGNYAPVIVNPQALMPPVKFRISKPRFTRDNELQWKINGAPGDYPIEVEQFKWNSWRQVASIDPVDTIENNVYTLPILPHSGSNIYRVKSIDIKGEEVESKELIFSASQLDRVYIQSEKIENEIVLSSKTEFEIYDLESNLLLSGYDRYINVKDLPKGKYQLFFDNQIEEFKKK
jgi:hypothetical protein